MRLKFGFVIIAGTIVLSGNLLPAQHHPGLTLRQTFNRYVEAVQHSDLETLFTTVTTDSEFCFLTSSGEYITTRQGYYDFHQRWFQEANWEMPVELLKVHEGESYGYTVAKFFYKSETPDERIYNLDSYFTLIFRKEADAWKVVTDICTPIRRYITDPEGEVEYTQDQEYLFDIFRNRRTVRQFKSTPVPHAHIMRILNAARYAPTAGNQQPWKFLVVQDRNTLDQLKEKALAWYIESYQAKRQPSENEPEAMKNSLRPVLQNVLSAPVYVAVLVDSLTKYPQYIIHDGTLAAGYLMIAARSLGYGTGFFTTFFPEDHMKEFFDIPDRYKLICFTPIGIPEKWPETPPKKKSEDLIVFEHF
ncbi:MAG TPA: nitroreductase family protein [bacterium]|nr:nitroreductase family protein [bacterium]